MSPTDEDLWDDQQTAQFLNLSPLTLRKARMVGSNGPPFVKLGHAVRYVPSSVRQWCAERAQRSTTEQSRRPLTPQHPHRGPGRPRKARPETVAVERVRHTPT
jgi:predicted DNA-binding transcriptional regulator AlpA